MKSLQEIFPRGSKSFIEANPSAALTPKDNKSPVQVNVAIPRRGRMNRCESEYSLILEAQKRAGEIIRYEFEGITLRFAGVKYTPDFVVTKNTMHALRELEYLKGKIDKFKNVEWHGIIFIEIKGRYIKGKFERAIERFRHARTYWPEFQFEMHQKTKEGFKQIL